MEAEREIQKTYSIAKFAAELRRLADMLESNENYSIRLEDEEVVIPQDAVASIVYEIEEGSAEIEFQLSWETGKTEDNDKVEEEGQTENA